MNTKQLIGLVQSYNPGSEHVTLASIFAKYHCAERPMVINSGPPGTGKSESSIRLWQQLSDKNYVVLDNTTTPRGLFETALEYPGCDIVLDECSTLLRDRKSQEMLKQLMQGGSLVWTKKGKVERSEPFTGSIVINTNESVVETVSDRAYVNRTKSDKTSILEFNTYYVMQNHDAEKAQLITYIQNSVVGKPLVGLTEEEVAYVLAFVTERINNTENADGYSRRIIRRIMAYFTMAKTFFGTLDDDVKSFVEPFAEAYVSNKTVPSLVESLVPVGGIEKPSLVRLLVEKTGYTEQHCRNLIRTLVERGKLELEGKMVKKVSK